MIVSQFLIWAETAPASDRAEGVDALARAVLYSDLDPQQRRDAVRALTRFLDDPAPAVRRAMAEALAAADNPPRHLVLALAEDQAAVATLVLARSPVLGEADLVDCAAGAADPAQMAIAARPAISATLAAALVEVFRVPALVALVGNPGADISDDAFRRVLVRHGDEATVREALVARGGLPQDVRARLVAETAGALAQFVSDRNWLAPERGRRVARDAAERTVVAISGLGERHGENAGHLVAALRASGRLTVALMLRSLLSGYRGLFEATLADLAETPLARAEGFCAHPASGGFAALYRKAGLPEPLLPVFRLALTALAADGGYRGHVGLRLALVASVRDGCAALGHRRYADLLAMLDRFETEAARDDARRSAPARRGPMPPAVRADAATDLDERLRAAIAQDAAPPARPRVDLAALEAALLAA